MFLTTESDFVCLVLRHPVYQFRRLGPVQTSNFTCAESNVNEQNLLFLLISIRFGTCEVRRLNRALESDGSHRRLLYPHT